MPKPFLSVVVPVRNGMPFIEEALASVLATGIVDLEVVVLENFSTDGTAEWLAEQHDSRLRVLVATEPRSAGENWTAAAAAATGTWTKLLCADDFVTPGGLQRQLDAVKANPDAAMVASRRRIVSDAGKTVIARHGLSGFLGRIEGQRARRKAVQSGANPFGEPSSVLMRTDALQASLPFTEQYPYLTDLDMYVKVLSHGDFVGLPSTDGAFRLSATSWSAAIGNSQLQQHRDWIASLEPEGVVDNGAFPRLLVRARLRGRFLARRVVTSISGAIGGKRQPEKAS